MPEQSHARPALAVFAVTACVLAFLIGDRMRLNIDEGIYLHGAQRIWGGQALFRDFLGQAGPGTFWLSDLCFWLFGVSLRVARIPLFLGIACMTACVFFLAAMLTARRFAGAVALVFFLLETSDRYLLAVNHRWDSGAFGFLAATLAVAAIRRNSRALSLGAGASAAAAAWVTPSVGLVAIPIAAWMLFRRDLRALLPWLIGSGALVTAVCGGYLALQGSVGPMLRDFAWTARYYPAPNHVPYGFAGLGYADATAGMPAAAKLVFSIVLAWVYLPAILPVLAVAGWAAWFKLRRKPVADENVILLLLGCSLTLFASTYPRWDTGHLLYVTPIFYVLIAALIHRAFSARAHVALLVILAPVVLFLSVRPVLEARDYARIETPTGPISAVSADIAFVQSLLSRVRAGEDLFVFPNFPTVYFLTGGVNPTRYTNLQAGFVPEEDELEAIRELQNRPPRWVVYWDVPPERYLKTSPSADPARLRFHKMEQYLRDNYRWVETHDHWHGPYSILERKT